jgi:hypothetical protein
MTKAKRNRLTAILFAVLILIVGCETRVKDTRDYPAEHVFKEIAIPESNLFLRAAYLSKTLMEERPENRSRVLVDFTLPRITIRCFPDSMDVAASIKSNLIVQLIQNLDRTNSFAALPWGNGSIPVYSINGHYIDGEALAKMVGETCSGGIDLSAGQITLRLFPPELEIVEFKQKKENGLHGFHWLRDFNIYNSEGQKEIFTNHPNDISRIFVTAPHDVHQRALKELKIWRSNAAFHPSLPEIAPSEMDWGRDFRP